MVNVNQDFLNLNVCESKECDFKKVESVKTPEPSDRWNPIAHDALVKEFRSAVDNNPSMTLFKSITLHRYGQRYWSVPS